ncbi:hypothetical protein CCR75_000833 [Bremia lactucae]|uniref:Uncharacterized protein n=1 Tax=Bremia lactucae TaxID=4779 RepID=A0A976FNI7_BRELC|nr:hypothetical protein CCR75_000833 [Bremia lactucae]
MAKLIAVLEEACVGVPEAPSGARLPLAPGYVPCMCRSLRVCCSPNPGEPYKVWWLPLSVLLSAWRPSSPSERLVCVQSALV